jgi:hypothetical protein
MISAVVWEEVWGKIHAPARRICRVTKRYALGIFPSVSHLLVLQLLHLHYIPVTIDLSSCMGAMLTT